MSGLGAGCTPCSDCGADYASTFGAWLVPDALWRLATTDPAVALCPGCFVRRLEKQVVPASGPVDGREWTLRGYEVHEFDWNVYVDPEEGLLAHNERVVVVPKASREQVEQALNREELESRRLASLADDANAEASRFEDDRTEARERAEAAEAEVERLKEALRDLDAAADPYIASAAPHEQLFNGEDHRNFHRLSEAKARAADHLCKEGT